MGTGFLLVVVSAVLFGTMPFFAKQIYVMGGNSLTLCVHRFLFSLPFLYAILRFSLKIDLRITKKQLIKVIILSQGCAGTPVLLFSSYNYISSGMATTIHFVYPILVLLGCVLIYREKLTKKKGLCSILCLLGIMSFYSPGESGSLLGVVLAFLSGVTYAFYILYYSRSGLTEMNAYKLSFYISAVSSAEVFLIALFSKEMIYTLPIKAWGLSVGFAFMVSVVATVSFQMGTRLIGPEKSSMLSTFEPLTSVIAGAAIFGEKLTVKSAVGIVCILCAVILIAMKEKPGTAKSGEMSQKS